jgi:hypothetical protein
LEKIFVAAIPQLRIHFKIELAQLIWKDETASLYEAGNGGKPMV